MATNTISHQQKVDSVELEADEIPELIDQDTGEKGETNIEHYICCASARPPAFLSTMPYIPSSLEGMRNHKALNGYHSLNITNDLGRNRDSRCWVCLSHSEAFLPLSP